MNVVEAVLSTFLVALMVAGMMYAMTQSLHGRDAQQLVGHVRVYQDALIRHQRENPQDGVEDWFPAQCPATHAKPVTDAPRLNGGGCDLLATPGTPPTCPAGHTLIPGTASIDPTCRMTTIPPTGCPAGHTLVSGSMRACELDAAWTELAALDDPATPYHDGDTNLQKLDLHNLVEFSLSTQLHAGANVPTPYGGTYRVLSNGASPYLRLEFDVTGFEPAAYLVAQQIVPGLRSEIDPRPQANVHDENTAYVAAVHLRPGYARTIHEYVVDPVEVGNPGMGFGSPIKFAHPQYRGDGGVVGFGGETHRAGDRCDIFRSRAGGATVTDANGMFLSCRDDPKGVVVAGPIWVRSSEFAKAAMSPPCPGCRPLIQCVPPPPPGAGTITICPETQQDLTGACDVFQTGTFAPYDAYPPWPGSGRSVMCTTTPDPCLIDPLLCVPPDQCGLSISESGGVLNVQFYHLDGGTTPPTRTDGTLVYGPVANFGLTVADVPATDRTGLGVDAFINNNAGFAAWVASADGQAAQTPIVGLGCWQPGQTHQCGLEVTYAARPYHFQSSGPLLDDLHVQFFDSSTTPTTYGTQLVVNAPDVGFGPSWGQLWNLVNPLNCDPYFPSPGCTGPNDYFSAAQTEFDTPTVQAADLSAFVATNSSFAAWLATSVGQSAYNSACP